MAIFVGAIKIILTSRQLLFLKTFTMLKEVRPELHTPNFDILTSFSTVNIWSRHKRRLVRISFLGFPHKYGHISQKFKYK